MIFVLLQVLSPIHQAVSTNLGDRMAAWLYDRLTEACVRPPGMGHLEDPALTSDLTVARDFDLGMTGPPLSISMDFIASGMAEMVGGIASASIAPDCGSYKRHSSFAPRRASATGRTIVRRRARRGGNLRSPASKPPPTVDHLVVGRTIASSDWS